MQQLFESSFFMALGKAIAASIWQMGLLFLVYHFLIAVFKLKQAAPRNLLSTIFALGGFVWFAASFAYNVNKGASSALVLENTAGHQQLIEQFTESNQWQLLLNWAEYKFNLLLPYLSIAYLVVLMWFVLRLCAQLVQTNALRTKGILPVQEELQQLITALTKHLNLQKNITAFISNRIDIPATIGFLKPVILLPAVAVTHLTPAQLEAVLLHELAHIRRNDYFWNLLLSSTETLLFFNPFALLLIGIARKERENCCDDVVMQYKQNAAVYAEALLNVEKARIRMPQLAMALGDNKHHLMHRVKRILNLPAEKTKFSARLLVLLFFTVVFALMGWLLQTKQQSQNTARKNIASAIKDGTPLLITPAVFIDKENKTLSVNDKNKKLNLRIKKEERSKEYIVLNENGDQYKFEKLILEDLPAGWIDEFLQEKNKPLPAPAFKEVTIKRGTHKDSAFFRNRYDHYRTIEEQYARGLHKKNLIRIQTHEQPYAYYFNGKQMIDSVFEQYFRYPNQFNFEWKENTASAQQEKELLTEKMKQVRKRMATLAELRTKARTIELNRLKSFDTTVVMQHCFQGIPAEWMAVIGQPLAEMQQHPQVTIIIEDKKLYINGKPVVTDSTMQQVPKRKTIKVVEVMKL